MQACGVDSDFCQTADMLIDLMWSHAHRERTRTLTARRRAFMTCRYSYMIDNVILLITGTLHQRAISELVPKCHPLGSFEQMEAVNIAQTPAELYNAILVDTPLGA